LQQVWQQAVRQQVVFALLVPSCQQVWNKLLTTCNNLVDIVRLVARLFQQIQLQLITVMIAFVTITLCVYKWSSTYFLSIYHDCIRLATRLSQQLDIVLFFALLVPSLLQTYSRLIGTRLSRSTNWYCVVFIHTGRSQLVDKLLLVTNLQQTSDLLQGLNKLILCCVYTPCFHLVVLLQTNSRCTC
jgi:ABC-type nitrate/sulfonate/bicarbonate transport system permease component